MPASQAGRRRFESGRPLHFRRGLRVVSRSPLRFEGDNHMPKPEIEFFKPDNIPWEPVAGSATGGAGGAGVRQKILSRSEDGDLTRLLQFDAGVETTETITHDFWEEVWILEGELVDLGKTQTFTAGRYACRPPGVLHGPYRGPTSCRTL